MSAAQKTDLWPPWKREESLSEIGRALGKHAGSIHGVVASNEGLVPLLRRRSRLALTLAEREEIALWISTALPLSQIARRIGRARSGKMVVVSGHVLN